MFSLDRLFKRRLPKAIRANSPLSYEAQQLWGALQAQQALACSVQQLCWICEQLVTVAVDENSTPDAQRLAEYLPLQIELVRRSAERIGCVAPEQPAPQDPYSLASLCTLMAEGPSEITE